jgi:hypothetical protein
VIQRSATTTAPAGPADTESRQLPRTVLAAAAIQAVEAVGLLVAATLAGFETAAGHAYQTASGVAITLIAVGMAVVLALVARGLRRARRWSRTPAMLTQLFAGIIGVYLLQADRLVWGIPTIVLAVAGVGALLAPASIRVLTPGRTQKS